MRIALLGAGLFAKDVYVPLLGRFAADVELAAVWSRTEETALEFQAFAGALAQNAKLVHGEEGLNAILADANIDAVAIVLPVHVSGEVVMRALRAGKHVISEKPIAPTIEEARENIEAYRALNNGAVWNIAENFRYEDVFEAQADLVAKIGNVVKMDLLADMPMSEGNKYFTSAWRRDTALCPGGFLMDSSVHFSAAMRMLAEAAGSKMPVSVSAKTRSTTHLLPAPDTAIGTYEWDNGLLCNISWSFSAHPTRFALSISGTEGTVEVTRGGWTGSRANYQMSYKLLNDDKPTFKTYNFSGADKEFANFVRQAKAAMAGTPCQDNEALKGQPEAALLDLAMIECAIRSGDLNGAPVAIPHIAHAWPQVSK